MIEDSLGDSTQAAEERWGISTKRRRRFETFLHENIRFSMVFSTSTVVARE